MRETGCAILYGNINAHLWCSPWVELILQRQYSMEVVG